MLENTHGLDLDAGDLKLIQDALFTQEKILSVQSSAGGKNTKARLSEVQHLLGRVRRCVPQPAQAQQKGFRRGIIGLARAFAGRSGFKST